MIDLKNFSFKQIIFLVFIFMFISLAVSYTFSMHYIFNRTMTNQMHLSWENKMNILSEQIRFPIITESQPEIIRIIKLMDSPKIKHLSIYANNKMLYSYGNKYNCPDDSRLSDSVSITNRYICFNKIVTNKYNDQKIGYITMVVSKTELNTLIYRGFVSNSLITLALTVIIFSFLYLSIKKILFPLATLSSVMRRIANNKRGIRLNEEGTKDMRRIQKTFNHMIGTIEKHEENLDKKVLERTLELSNAYKKAKGASQVKSDILKIVSHEMKTPLTGAMLNLYLMEDGRGYFIPEIIEDVERLRLLIENLLEYSYAVEKEVILNKSLFSVPDFLEKINMEFIPLFNAQGNQLILDNIYQDTVFSDERLVKQIIINFITNANKFTSNGKVTVKCHVENSWLVFAVIDSGCGICEDDLEKIFDAFWQVDMSSKRHYKGTGLGLSICYLFAEALNGHIKVKSKLNYGSEFTLSIPLYSETEGKILFKE